MRVKFVVAYDGRRYRGSQIQPNVATVQDELEKALHKIRAFGGRTTFAGRTDAGVHAVGQVVSCDVAWDREIERLDHGLNSVLPEDIRILGCERVHPRFNARFDARSREYRYRIASTRVLPPQLARFVWGCGTELHSARAQPAAALFQGTHTFGSFASAGRSSEHDDDLRRTILSCEWRDIEESLFPIEGNDGMFELRIRANGFLPQMVRNIVSAVVEVASGKKPQEWIEFLLVSGDRRLLGPPAPPHGLVLWDVEYPAETDTLTGKMG